MPADRYALTEHDARLIAALEGAGKHLNMLARLGRWDVRAHQLHDRLGRYGLGRN